MSLTIFGVVLISYVVMLAAFYWSRIRRFHVPVMASVILLDAVAPFYLYLTRDWYKRLIVHEEIFSFLLWMHFGLVLVLYGLYIIQVKSAFKVLKNQQEARVDHRQQGKAIILVRGLVVLTASLLIDPDA